MKRTMLVLGALLGAAGWGAASSPQPNAFSVPVSDKVLEGQVQLPNGSHADVVVRDGGMVTIRDERNGYMLGLAAKVDDPAKKTVGVRAFDIHADGEGQAAEEIPGTAMDGARIGRPHAVNAAGHEFEFQIQAIKQGIFPPGIASSRAQGAAPDTLQRIFGASGGGTCCLTCSGFTVCASRVSMGCGVCTADFMIE